MTEVRVVKTPPGQDFIPIGDQGTYSKGDIVDVSELNTAELKHLLDEEYVEIVPEA